MKVTNVWVKKYPSGKLLGFADVQLSLDNSDEGHMVWKGFKIFQGKDKVQIGLPSKKDEKGNTDDNGRPIYHPVITVPVSDEKPNPVGAKFLEELRVAVEAAYNKEASGAPANSGKNKDYVTDSDCPF